MVKIFNVSSCQCFCKCVRFSTGFEMLSPGVQTAHDSSELWFVLTAESCLLPFSFFGCLCFMWNTGWCNMNVLSFCWVDLCTRLCVCYKTRLFVSLLVRTNIRGFTLLWRHTGGGLLSHFYIIFTSLSSFISLPWKLKKKSKAWHPVTLCLVSLKYSFFSLNLLRALVEFLTTAPQFQECWKSLHLVSVEVCLCFFWHPR